MEKTASVDPADLIGWINGYFTLKTGLPTRYRLRIEGKGNVDANTFCFWYSIEGTAKGGFFRCIGCTNTITSNALQHGRGVRSPCFPYFSYFTSESLSGSGLASTIVPDWLTHDTRHYTNTILSNNLETTASTQQTTASTQLPHLSYSFSCLLVLVFIS